MALTLLLTAKTHIAQKHLQQYQKQALLKSLEFFQEKKLLPIVSKGHFDLFKFVILIAQLEIIRYIQNILQQLLIPFQIIIQLTFSTRSTYLKKLYKHSQM